MTDTARRMMLALGLIGFGGVAAATNANETPALRPGAKVCDLDPDTGKRAVYLPAIWHDVTEVIVTGEAFTKLVYNPAVFKRDGTLAEQAWVSERIIPNFGKHVTRPIILAPEQTGHITADGRLLNSDGLPIDETFNLKLLNRASAFRIRGSLEYWDQVFEAFMRSLRSTYAQAMANFRHDGHISSMPRVIAPDLSWVHDLTYLKVDAEMPISILVEPAEIQYLPSEQEVVDRWEAFAQHSLRENRKSYACAGPTLIVKDLGPDSFPTKTFAEIGIRTPITVTPPKIRYFNLYGAEIK